MRFGKGPQIIGQPGKPNIRAKLVAQNLRTDAGLQLYAPTPEDVVVGDRHGCTWKYKTKGVLPRTVVQESICRITTR